MAISRSHRIRRFVRDVVAETPFVKMLLLLVSLWLAFAWAMTLAERGAPGASIDGFLDGLYWGVAAFSTAGIADAPATSAGKIIGALWIVLGSIIFFGSIVATITIYFMRPLQRPARRIVDTIEFNLEQLDELSLEELDLLKDTVDTLIEHMEGLRRNREAAPPP